MTKLNLACGNVVLNGWDNLDYESRTEGVMLCNLLDKLPYDDCTVDEILASHFLEHLKLRTEAVPFLQECARVLRENGLLTIIVPDFEMLQKIKMYDYHFNRLRNKCEQLRWLVGATFGEGRTNWDYHVSGWFKERFKEMGEGRIIIDPAGGEALTVWLDAETGESTMELARIIPEWRSHGPYEITAIFRKKSSENRGTAGLSVLPTCLTEPKVVGNGYLSPFRYTLKRLPAMIKRCFREKCRFVSDSIIPKRLVRK